MSGNLILGTGEGQGQVTKDHYMNVTFRSCDACFAGYFGHWIRWLRWFDHLRPFLDVFSEGQVNVRIKGSNFESDSEFIVN